MRVFVVSVAFSALIAAVPVPAQEPNDDPVIQSYLDKGLSEQEARRRISYSRRAADLEARLIAAEPVRFAGLYVDDAANFRVVVRLVGDAEGLLRRYVTDPVFVAEKAPVPLRALENKQAALINALKGIDGRFAVSINTRSGRLRVFATNRQAAQSSIGRAGIAIDDVDIEEGGLPTPAASVFGGGTINGQVYCEPSGTGCKQENGTTGFTITNGAVRGILTAGHFGECTNMPSTCVKNSSATDQSGAALTFKAQRNAGSEDFEWRTGPAGTVYPNAIRYSTTTMSITAVGDPTPTRWEQLYASKGGWHPPIPAEQSRSGTTRTHTTVSLAILCA